MSWRLANSLTTLRNQINEAYPNRSKVSDGTIGDEAHSSTVSQHNPNSAGVVTAMDITHDPANGVHGDYLAEALIGDQRTWYVIWNYRIWEDGWQPYYGENQHSSHVHISVNQDAGSYDNNSKWDLKGEIMLDDNGITNMYIGFVHYKPTKADLDFWRGKPYDTLQAMLMNSSAYADVNRLIGLGKDAEKGFEPIRETLYQKKG